MVQKKSKYGLNTGGTLRKHIIDQLRRYLGRDSTLDVSITKLELFDDEKYVEDLLKYKTKVLIDHGLPYGIDETNVKQVIESDVLSGVYTKDYKLHQLRNHVTELTGTDWHDCTSTEAVLNLNKRGQWNALDVIKKSIEELALLQKYFPFDAWDSSDYNEVFYKHDFGSFYCEGQRCSSRLPYENQTRPKKVKKKRIFKPRKRQKGLQRNAQKPKNLEYIERLYRESLEAEL